MTNLDSAIQVHSTLDDLKNFPTFQNLQPPPNPDSIKNFWEIETTYLQNIYVQFEYSRYGNAILSFLDNFNNKIWLKPRFPNEKFGRNFYGQSPKLELYLLEAIFLKRYFQYDQLVFAVSENGECVQNTDPILMWVKVGTKKKYNMKNASTNFIHACESCDQAIHPQFHSLPKCPFCDSPLKLYERLGAIHFVSFDESKRLDFKNAISQCLKSTSQYELEIPILLEGKHRKILLKRDDFYDLLVLCQRHLTLNRYGPFQVYPDYDPKWVTNNRNDLYIHFFDTSTSVPLSIVNIQDKGLIYPKKRIYAVKKNLFAHIKQQKAETQKAKAKFLQIQALEKKEEQMKKQKEKLLAESIYSLNYLLQTKKHYQVRSTLGGVYVKFTDNFVGDLPKLYAALYSQKGDLASLNGDYKDKTHLIRSISFRYGAIIKLLEEIHLHFHDQHPTFEFPIQEVVTVAEKNGDRTCEYRIVGNMFRCKTKEDVAVCANCDYLIVGTTNKQTHQVTFHPNLYNDPAHKMDLCVPPAKICPACGQALKVRFRPKKVQNFKFSSLGNGKYNLIGGPNDFGIYLQQGQYAILVKMNLNYLLSFLHDIQGRLPNKVFGGLFLRLDHNSGVFHVVQLKMGMMIEDVDDRPESLLPEDLLD